MMKFYVIFSLQEEDERGSCEKKECPLSVPRVDGSAQTRVI